MMIANIATIGVVIGVVACGGLFAWMFRREPRKTLNIAVLTLGLALLAYGHLQWAVRRESEEIKEALFIRHVVAGWAMVTMGVVGLQCGGRPAPKDEP